LGDHLASSLSLSQKDLLQFEKSINGSYFGWLHLSGAHIGYSGK